MRYAVAASSEWVDPDGVRRPGGEVHAWTPSANQTLCGLALSRSRLGRYPHVDWDDIRPSLVDTPTQCGGCARAAWLGPVRGETRGSGVVKAPERAVSELGTVHGPRLHHDGASEQHPRLARDRRGGRRGDGGFGEPREFRRRRERPSQTGVEEQPNGGD
jgi:hypothetical protein